MQFTTESLRKIVNLNNTIIANNNLRKPGPLSNLIFVIKEGRLYTLSQGQKNVSVLLLLTDCGATDEPDGVYAIDGSKLSKTLAECSGEVQLKFISDEDTHEVVLETDFGKVKFSVYRVETSTQDTDFNTIIPKLLEMRQETEQEGHTLSQEDWQKYLAVSTATKDDSLVPFPFIVHPEMIGVNVPYMVVRYHADLPYKFSTDMEIVKVLRQVVNTHDEDTKSRLTNFNNNNMQQFHIGVDNVYMYVIGVNPQDNSATLLPWKQNETMTGKVNREHLQRLLRISNIFTETDSDITVEWDFPNSTVKVYNSGANLPNQEGTQTRLPFSHNSDSEVIIKTAVHGQTILDLLNYTQDEEVSVEIKPSERQLHITFSEGDFYVFYKAL